LSLNNWDLHHLVCGKLQNILVFGGQPPLSRHVASMFRTGSCCLSMAIATPGIIANKERIKNTFFILAIWCPA